VILTRRCKRVRKLAGCLESICRLFNKGFFEKPVELTRQSGDMLGRWRDRIAANPDGKIAQLGTIERSVCRKQPIQNHGQRPKISPAVKGQTAHLFGAHVKGRAQHDPAGGGFAADNFDSRSFGNPEVQ